MSTCRRCGTTLVPDAQFCHSCGFTMIDSREPPLPASVPEQTAAEEESLHRQESFSDRVDVWTSALLAIAAISIFFFFFPLFLLVTGIMGIYFLWAAIRWVQESFSGTQEAMTRAGSTLASIEGLSSVLIAIVAILIIPFFSVFSFLLGISGILFLWIVNRWAHQTRLNR